MNGQNRRRLRRTIAAIAACCGIAVIVWLVFGARLRESAARRQLAGLNVILITLDTLRADRVGAYSREFADTPALDALANDGVVFENCICQTPLTLPEHATILSGTYPLYHRVRDNGGFVVPPQLRFVSEILREKGFATAAFIASYVLHSKWGVNKGFDLFSDRFDFGKYNRIALGEVEKNAAEVLADARNWIGSNSGRRFFAWIHLYDPHAPYRPPSPFRERYAGDAYSGEVAYMDSELGKFFDFLKSQGLWQRSLIIATGDHGEALGEHQEMNHGFFLYESCLRVPLIVRAPVRFGLRRVSKLVEHVDLAPTIVDALRLASGQRFDGHSLLPLLFGHDVPGFENAYSETWYPRLHFGWSELKSVHTPERKYILAPREEIYDWRADRTESSNLLFRESLTRPRLRERLDRLVGEYSSQALSPENFRGGDSDAIERLQTLGYITASVDVRDDARLADPKEKIGVYNDLQQAKEFSEAGQVPRAIDIVSAIIRSNPEIIDAYMFLGNLHFLRKDFRAALADFRGALKRKPDYNFAMLNVIKTLKAMEDSRAALAEIDHCLGIFPADAVLHFEKADVYSEEKQYNLALVPLRRAVELDPNYIQALNKLGEIYFYKREFEVAIGWFRKALAVNPKLASALFNLALIAEAQGNRSDAEERYRSVLSVRPDHLQANYNLAELLRQTGRYEDALPFYRQAIASDPAFSIPYFMLAKYYLDRRQNLNEAIGMCEKGVAQKPENKYTAFGYYILADIYSYLGDPARSREYAERGDAVMRRRQK